MRNFVNIAVSQIPATDSWAKVATINGDTIQLNTTSIKSALAQDEFWSNPFVWNIISVLIGATLSVVCNLITQWWFERKKLIKDQTIFTIDLAWMIARGIEFSRSVDRAAFAEYKDHPMRYLVILSSIGADPKPTNFDITKVGFLATKISPEFPSKAQEYLTYVELISASIKQRNKVYLNEFQPALQEWQRQNPNSKEVDLREIEAFVGAMTSIKLKQITDSIYFQIDYLESNGNDLINQINAALIKMNRHKKKPPQITIIPKNQP